MSLLVTSFLASWLQGLTDEVPEAVPGGGLDPFGILSPRKELRGRHLKGHCLWAQLLRAQVLSRLWYQRPDLVLGPWGDHWLTASSAD